MPEYYLSDCELEIFNIQGQEVEANMVSHNCIDISDLASGIYIINAVDINGNTLVNKIIKL